MKRITFDESLRRKLRDFNTGVDICDESGFVLAHVEGQTSGNGSVRIPADDELRERFSNFSEDIEICDEYGNVVAQVEARAPWSYPGQWEPVEPPSAEEVQRALNSKERRYTTEEVLDYLRKL